MEVYAKPPTREEFKLGDMPKPIYMARGGDTTGIQGEMDWIGVWAYSLDGEIKDFIWWNNYKMPNINEFENREEIAYTATHLIMVHGAEVAIGLPVDTAKSNPKSKIVAIPDDSELYGIFVETRLRAGFNFNYGSEGMKGKSVEQVRMDDRLKFDQTFANVLANLPYDNRRSSSSG